MFDESPRLLSLFGGLAHHDEVIGIPREAVAGPEMNPKDVA